jgi:hypothetical protein
MKHPFDDCEKGFNKNAHVVKIAFLHASPNTRPVSNCDRERVQQDHANGAIFTYDTEDRTNECLRREGTLMDVKSVPVGFTGSTATRKCRPALSDATSVISLMRPG